MGAGVKKEENQTLVSQTSNYKTIFSVFDPQCNASTDEFYDECTQAQRSHTEGWYTWLYRLAHDCEMQTALRIALQVFSIIDCCHVPNVITFRPVRHSFVTVRVQRPLKAVPQEATRNPSRRRKETAM